MKLAYIIQGLYNSAGMERVVINKANYFSEIYNYDVYIITTDQKHRPTFFPINKNIHLIDLDINFIDYANTSTFNRLNQFIKKQTTFKRKLKEILLSIHPDITITLMYKNLSFLYKINDGSRKIVECHFHKNIRKEFETQAQDGIFLRLVYRIWGYIETQALKHYDKYVLLTHEDANAWSNSLNNITVIPNFIFYEKFQTSKLNTKRAISVGRLEYQKGYDLLLKMWSQIHKSCPDWVLEIYGSGPELPKLQELIKELNLQKAVYIYPPTKDILHKIQNASLYLMSSRFEGLPMVLLEAMATGVPAVAFSCKCGPKDIITDGKDGYLIPPDHLDDYIKKVIYLCQNHDQLLIMGNNAKKDMKRFDAKVITNQWNELFLNLKTK